MSGIMCKPEDIAGALLQMSANNILEDMRQQRHEADLLKSELYNVIEALHEGRIDFNTAVRACELLEATASDPILTQEEAKQLWQLCAERVITSREMLMLCDIAQSDVLRKRQEFRQQQRQNGGGRA